MNFNYGDFAIKSPHGGGHENSLDPIGCKAPSRITTLVDPSTSCLRHFAQDDEIRYFTNLMMSSAEFAMRFLKFQMRAKVLP